MTNFIKIKSVCKYITRETCTTLVLMLCMSHLDYSNALLYGLPNKNIKRYQMIQNICAKLVLVRPKYSSSTKTLKCLHWLPIQQRINHKIENRTTHIQMHQQGSPKIPAGVHHHQKANTKKICAQTTPVLYLKYKKSNIKHLLWGHSNMLHQKHCSNKNMQQPYKV